MKNFIYILTHKNNPDSHNILILINDLNDGGAQKVVNNLCNNLKDYYHVSIGVSKEDAEYRPLVDVTVIKGIMALKRFKIENNIGITISFLTRSNFKNVITYSKDKTIISIRNYMSICNKYNHGFLIAAILNKLNKFSLKYADLIVNVCDAVKQDNINFYHADGNKMKTIYNFCEIQQINELRMLKIDKQYSQIFNNKVVINVGSFTKQKGQWHLIRAFKKVADVCIDYKLVLLGRGKYKKYYQQLIDELDLKKNVYLIDFDLNPYKYMYNSNLFILTSTFEGMPNVILEAMACSLPIIATDSYGGVQEILSDKKICNDKIKTPKCLEYGVLIPACDNKLNIRKKTLSREEIIMADTILDLLSNKEKLAYYKQQSIKRINNFNKEAIFNQWMDVI